LGYSGGWVGKDQYHMPSLPNPSRRDCNPSRSKDRWNKNFQLSVSESSSQLATDLHRDVTRQ
jgi:hypothetical protein